MTQPDQLEADVAEPLSLAESHNGDGGALAQANGNDGTMNDHQLLSGYVHGDERAFESLVGKYFPMVYTVAVRRTRDPHLAEEIAQSVFLILARKARRLSSRSSVAGWLIRTSRFVCRDAIKMCRRRQQNERRLASTIEHQAETLQQQSPMGLLLEEAINSLRPDEQAGIVARFFEGKNFREMAEMFGITEITARKRTSRSVAKLQAFMEKRGVRMAVPALFGLLEAPHAHAYTAEALKSAIHAAHTVWKGKVAAKSAAVLAERAIRLLRWRFLASLSLKVALPMALIFAGGWTVREWTIPAEVRIEKLGRAWGVLDRRVAQDRQFLIQTPPNTPNYRAKVQQELAAIGRQSSRIISESNPLLALPDERVHLAEFLTAELGETLKLEPSRKATLFSYIQDRLAQGATLNEAMKAIAESTQTEAEDIKAMLSPGQRQLFDQIYGVGGGLLFSYAKAVALKKIGS